MHTYMKYIKPYTEFDISVCLKKEQWGSEAGKRQNISLKSDLGSNSDSISQCWGENSGMGCMRGAQHGARTRRALSE